MKAGFTWDRAKAERNLRIHGVSFETAEEAFDDPNHLAADNYFIESEGEQRYQLIGMTRNLVLVLVVFVDRSEPGIEIIHLISARKAVAMKRASTKTSSVKRLNVSVDSTKAYDSRDLRLDSDPDAPQLPPEYWDRAVVGKYYRPRKTQISLRVDNEVLDWLKSKGEGHLSRINEILREQMARERQ